MLENFQMPSSAPVIKHVTYQRNCSLLAVKFCFSSVSIQLRLVRRKSTDHLFCSFPKLYFLQRGKTQSGIFSWNKPHITILPLNDGIKNRWANKTGELLGNVSLWMWYSVQVWRIRSTEEWKCFTQRNNVDEAPLGRKYAHSKKFWKVCMTSTSKKNTIHVMINFWHCFWLHFLYCLLHLPLWFSFLYFFSPFPPAILALLVF